MKFVIALVFMLSSFLAAISPISTKKAEAALLISPSKLADMFAKGKNFDSRELIIKFKPSVTDEEKRNILQEGKVTEKSSLQSGNVSLVSVSKPTDLVLLAKSLLENNQIEFVEPNYRVKRTYIPSDPEYGKQWYLNQIQMPKVWDQTKGAANVAVAVIDGGVDITHPDLAGKIISPYNIVTGAPSVPSDDHGTHVSGIIAASINQTGISGIAPNVKIMPVNVFQNDFAEMYDIAKAIYYAVDHKADIINMSLGGYEYSSVLYQAAKDAESKGVILVSAAGNDRTPMKSYPAAFNSVLAVSATNEQDRITSFSNFGSYLDFAAPGENIYSTVAGKSYQYMDGTSMAAPVVSGVAALILSKDPMLSGSEVKEILRKSTVDLGTIGWDKYYGNGRIDAYKAVQNTPSPISPITASADTFTINGTSKDTFSFTTQGGTVVNLYVVQNSSGITIRKLISNKSWTGGKLSASWDGKTDGGTYVPGGTYKIVVKLSNGKKNVYRTKYIKVVNKVTPAN